MSLFSKIKHLGHGAVSLVEWVGDKGEVVEQWKAEERARICRRCVKNQPGGLITEAIAGAIKRHLEVKNELGLHVEQEQDLLSCNVCDCPLKTLVWIPRDVLERRMTSEERKESPPHCWKLLVNLGDYPLMTRNI